MGFRGRGSDPIRTNKSGSGTRTGSGNIGKRMGNLGSIHRVLSRHPRRGSAIYLTYNYNFA